MPPKVLVPEKLSPDGLALLRQSLDVDERKGLSPEDLISIIPEYDALVIRSETKVTASVLKAAKNLKVVARAGVGVDNVGKIAPLVERRSELKIQTSMKPLSTASSSSTPPPATFRPLPNTPSL